MASIEEYAEVRAAGLVFRDWTSVAVNWGLTTNWYRSVRLQCAEVAKLGAILRLKPGDDISVSLAGRPFIGKGKVRVRQAAYDANRHAVQIEGWGYPGETTESAADVKEGSQFRGYSLSSLANKALQRHGLKLKMENAPSGADKPFDNVMIHYGETVFEFIERLCRQRDCFLWADEQGILKAGLPSGSGVAAGSLVEGVNILAANCTITDPAAEIRVSGQDSGSDQRFGSQVAPLAAKANITGFGSNRLFIGLAEEPSTKEELQMRVSRETRELLAQSIQAQVTHKGWLKPGTSDLWTLGDTVQLKSPMLIPTTDGALSLRVWDVTYSQDAQMGTATSLVLVNQGVFAQKAPDGKAEGDGFVSPKATPPQDDSSAST